MDYKRLQPKRVAGKLLRIIERRDKAARDGVDLGYLRQLVGGDASVVLEIGANDGVDSLRLAEAFPAADIHCFEPDPRALGLLRGNATIDRMHVYDVAISSADGTVDFHQSAGAPPGTEDQFPDGWHMSGSVRTPKHHLEVHPWCTFDETIEVRSVRLDTWALEASVGPVDLIWADVQGAEIDLIEGGRQTLAATKFLYTEFSNAELYEGQVGLDGLLEQLPGWEIEQLYSGDVLLRNTALA